ncbi:STAS domain-containing protein [Thiorhodospira sibirica]|uniref:STAS domain-containing protein n=1 Tax=Thiorhodospira sibirica TaxID=154347 RepID=UPI00022C0B1C|nr:STAS domain-containing protein [Thiorhodospira sibirica]
MEITEETVNDVSVVMLKQRIDSATAKVFEERLQEILEKTQGRLIIDFAQLNYISSAGLRVLLMAAKTMNAKKLTLLLCGMKPEIYEVFEVSGFTKILTIVEDRDAALALAA